MLSTALYSALISNLTCVTVVWCIIRYSTDDVWSGDWTHVTSLDFPPSWGGGVHNPNATFLRNEDPYLYFDASGGFHVLGHRYDYRDGYPVNPNQTMPVLVSGHAYSRDGLDWRFNSAQQPFDPIVTFTNGTVQQFSTFERPHLVFGGPNGTTPTHLVSAVQPYWLDPQTGNACDGCDARVGSAHSCVVCKTSKGIDYTFTLVLKLGSSGSSIPAE